MGFRSERPQEKATAEAFQEALGKVGIKVTPKPYPDGDYFSALCGKPDYVVKNNLGLCTNGWGADWNDGFGFLSQIVDSRVIQPDRWFVEHLRPHPRGGQDARRGQGGAGHGQARGDVG